MEMNLENKREVNFKEEYASQSRLNIINWNPEDKVEHDPQRTVDNNKLASPKSLCCKMWEEIFL